MCDSADKGVPLMKPCFPNEKRKMTNFEKITQSEDKLANVIDKALECCRADDDICIICPFDDCFPCTKKGILKWLKQEVRDEHD